MATNIITPPAEYPVTVAEMRDWLHETVSTSQDDVITSNIASAVDLFEGETGRKLITQTLEQTEDNFPEAINFDFLPVISITSIKYDDDDGTEQTLSSLDYKLDNSSPNKGWIVPAVGKIWPSTYATAINTVRVQYVAGYGAAAAVPEDIKNWIKAHAADLYHRRGEISHESAVNHPYFQRIAAKYRTYR
ncbi:head-tail connector protein [Nitrosomonas marina]|uniref:Phage gp6-like head-tail connector protein n=1 Tax=Nitrosomonas marina TaxID=917 RepID=A0A1H8GJQ8_9PROT|nr:hypothetical protein [Nitrosomonas marina]SEN43548.1 phage conserved hypothetical protein, phiE125 gp8 family [Nitrosomonas marina]